MSREPEHVSSVTARVLGDIERAYCAAHGLPVDDTDAETPDEPAPCRRRGRDPPTGALRVKGMFGSQHEDDERGNE